MNWHLDPSKYKLFWCVLGIAYMLFWLNHDKIMRERDSLNVVLIVLGLIVAALLVRS